MTSKTVALEIYDTYSESKYLSGVLLEEGSFETEIIGGFGKATFPITLGVGTAIQYWYKNYLNKHVVVYSLSGDRLYEGRIERSDLIRNGVSFSCLGYFAHANDLLSGLIYPTSTPTSISEVVIDQIDLTTAWTKKYEFIQATTTDITPLDFTGDAKLVDAIKKALSYGSDNTPPRPLNFQIWDKRVPYMTVEPDTAFTKVNPDFILTTNIKHSDEYGASIGLEQTYNKIQVLYDDPDIGQTFTTFYEDANSQAQWGVREGTINIGSSLPGIADVVGDLAIEAYKDPRQSTRISFQALSLDARHKNRVPLYYLRAGNVIRIDDVDPLISDLMGYNLYTQNDAMSVVSKTGYDIGTGNMTITPGTRNLSFEILLTQLGIGSGDVR